MKILFFSLGIFQPLGGIQRFNQRVARAINEDSKMKFQAVSLADSSESLANRNWLSGANGSRFKFLVLSVSRMIWPDVLFIDHINLLPLVLLAKTLNPKLKVVMFGHGVEIWDDPTYRRRKRFDIAILKLVTRAAIVSNYSTSIFCSKFSFDKEKCFNLPNAVDFFPNTEVESLSRGEAPTVLTVTRLASSERAKHVDKLIIALSGLKSTFPDIKLEIVGQGDLVSELKELAITLGVEDNVIFQGRLSDAELLQAYSRATLFALPSTKEGFGIVYLEAWMQGLPVIAGNAGAGPEVVTHGVNGLVVDPQNSEELKEALLLLISNKAINKELAAHGAGLVEKKYSHQVFSKNIRTLLTQLQ